MKITGTLKNNVQGREIYHIHFDDGITVNLRRMTGDKFEYDNMLSTGPDSYYLKKGKFPKGANLKKRIELGVALIKKNIQNNRYKDSKKGKKKDEFKKWYDKNTRRS